MNQKNTTKADPKKTAAVKPVEKKNDVLAAPMATYTTFAGMLTAKSRKTLPRGTKASIFGDKITFAAKGNIIATLPLADFANGELKRHGFQLAV